MGENDFDTDNCGDELQLIVIMHEYMTMEQFAINFNIVTFSDIDECATTIPCPTQEYKKCSNVYGSYECICMTGYYNINDTCSGE